MTTLPLDTKIYIDLGYASVVKNGKDCPYNSSKLESKLEAITVEEAIFMARADKDSTYEIIFADDKGTKKYHYRNGQFELTSEGPGIWKNWPKNRAIRTNLLEVIRDYDELDCAAEFEKDIHFCDKCPLDTGICDYLNDLSEKLEKEVDEIRRD